MFNARVKTGIAIIAFYIPALLVAAHYLFCRHGRPRLAWYILLMFSLIRLASGIIIIVYEQQPSVGLGVPVIILSNPGAFPLIAATIGFIRIIIAQEHKINPRVHQGLAISRMLFFVGIPLLIAGGILKGQDSHHLVSTGDKLVKAGYIIIAVFVGCLLAFITYFWNHYSTLTPSSATALQAMSLAFPFIVVRITYLFFSEFEASNLKWALTVTLVPFILMALVMEYAVVCIYLITGMLLPASKYTSMAEGDMFLSEP